VSARQYFAQLDEAILSEGWAQKMAASLRGLGSHVSLTPKPDALHIYMKLPGGLNYGNRRIKIRQIGADSYRVDSKDDSGRDDLFPWETEMPGAGVVAYVRQQASIKESEARQYFGQRLNEGPMLRGPQLRNKAKAIANRFVSGLNISTQFDLMTSDVGSTFTDDAERAMDNLRHMMVKNVTRILRRRVVDMLVDEIENAVA
jgi:hypothetical protein